MTGCRLRARFSIQPFRVQLIAGASLGAEIVTLVEITFHNFFGGILHLRGLRVRKREGEITSRGCQVHLEGKRYKSRSLCFGGSKLGSTSWSLSGLNISFDDEAALFVAYCPAH